MIACSSARIGDDVDHGRLAALHRGDRALERSREVVGIDDRAFAIGAHAARHHGVVDVGVLERGADIGLLHAAAVPRRHRQEVHVFLVIGAVVVDDVEHRDLVVRGGPQGAGIEHEVAIAAKGDGETAVLLVGERGAERSRQVIADAGTARDAVPAVRLVEIPQPMRPGDADAVADQRPVLVLDPVSYTHLDVYKRQAFDCSTIASRAAASFLPRASNAFLRPSSSSRLICSMSAGVDPSPSPAIAMSMSWKRPKSW